MSIVGTRPPLISETNLYEPHHKARLAIKPGITGMWQVSGRSDITDFEEVVRLDKEYIENWDIGLDIKILLKTVMVVVKNLEIILIDDGSPDHCGKIADGYASKDSRIQVIHQKNAGVSASRNIGLEKATGEYIYPES